MATTSGVLVPYQVLRTDYLPDPSQEHWEVGQLSHRGCPRNISAVPLPLYLRSRVEHTVPGLEATSEQRSHSLCPRRHGRVSCTRSAGDAEASSCCLQAEGVPGQILTC